MAPDDVAEIYTMIATLYERPLSELACRGWQMTLGKYDDDVVTAAVTELLSQDRPFPPKPGEVVMEIRRIAGDIQPSPDAALGLYLSGDLSNPLVAAAAAQAHWDPNDPTKGTEARMRFKGAYAMAVEDWEDNKLRPVREALTAEGRELLELLGGESTR